MNTNTQLVLSTEPDTLKMRVAAETGNFTRAHRRPPTVWELCLITGQSSLAMIQDYLSRLVSIGMLCCLSE